MHLGGLRIQAPISGLSDKHSARPITHTTVVAVAVPSVPALYGVGWADEPPSRGRISL